jgi:Protein of unknown function (DUF630)
MGCRISKFDEPTIPVLLCRERRDLIRAVEDNRRALASAHMAYFHSLSRVGDALLQFVQQDLSSISSPSTLTLPPSPDGKNAKHRKFKSPGSAFKEKESDLALSDSSVSPFHSSCASLEQERLDPNAETDPHFLSGSDCEEGMVGESENTRFRGNPRWTPYVGFTAYPGLISNVGMANYQYNYMKSSSTVSTTVYQQPYCDNANQVYMDYGYRYNYPMYGFKMPPESSQTHSSEKQIDSESSPPPPPVPMVSGWDFFNPFDSYERSLNMGLESQSGFSSGSIRSSPNSSEVREKEGIPELEEETEQESFKGSSKKEVCSSEMSDEETTDTVHSGSGSEHVVILKESVEQAKPTSDHNINVKIRKMKKVSFEEDATLANKNRDGNEGLNLSVQSGTRKIEEVMREIKEEFGSLVSCGAEVATLLDANSIPYRSSNMFLRCGY